MVHIADGITAATHNAHYASISPDAVPIGPIAPIVKLRQHARRLYGPQKNAMFCALSALTPTAEGPDEVPYWFLKLASPVIAAPVAHLFHLS